MSDIDDTGYDSHDYDGDEVEVVYRVEPMEHMHSKGKLGRVLRNGIPIGMVRCQSEAELQWLMKRVNGTFDPEQWEESEG